MHCDGPWLKDKLGRTLLLRGVNLGGSSKVPRRPDGSTHIPQDLRQHRDVSFVGRPFPIEEADEHFRRLAAWGLSFLRFVITWEAIEHAGPGLYDQEYLDYLDAIVGKAADHGLSVYIDPHQDVWSRFSGGDGAPGWTLEAVGFDIGALHETGAAFVHQAHGGTLNGLIWPSNATKLAAGSMFALFFAGDDFAPGLRLDGEGIQSALQRRYIAALCQVAARLAQRSNVVGYGSMNEPMPGFLGLPLADVPTGMIKKGACPTPYQAMLAGAGYPQTVEEWEMSPAFIGQVGHTTLNPQGKSAWRRPEDDVWRNHGVWTDEGHGPRLLRPDYFLHRPGQPSQAISFERDYLKPLCVRVIQALRRIAPRCLLFFEGPPIPVGTPPPWDAGSQPAEAAAASAEPAPCRDPDQVVHAPHWYDGLTLFTKHFARDLSLDLTCMRPVLGAEAVRESYASQLAYLRAQHPNLPMLLGEFGLNFDLDGGAAYRSGDYRDQIDAIDGYYAAVEATRISCTQWNYTSDNSHEWGDNWNAEDLSIFSPDDRRFRGSSDIHAGGRALAAIVRPYPRATAGEPLRLAYDLQTRSFSFELRCDPRIQAASEIFVPHLPYGDGDGFRVQAPLGDVVIERHAEHSIVSYRPHPGSDGALHTLRIVPRSDPGGEPAEGIGQ